MGVYSEDSLEANVVMFRLVFVVAVAKAEFLAAYEAAAAGGLADLQAPAPVHEIPVPAPAAAPVPAPVYTGNLLPYYPYNHLLPSSPYVAGYGYPYHGYGYN